MITFRNVHLLRQNLLAVHVCLAIQEKERKQAISIKRNGGCNLYRSVIKLEITIPSSLWLHFGYTKDTLYKVYTTTLLIKLCGGGVSGLVVGQTPDQATWQRQLATKKECEEQGEVACIDSSWPTTPYIFTGENSGHESNQAILYPFQMKRCMRVYVRNRAGQF